MKSPNEYITEWSHQSTYLKELSNDEIKSIQRVLLKMYNHIENICRINDISVFVGGGGCLGAIRHKGFIPWDDDLDLVMLRPDYDRFIQICENGALGDEYDFRYPDGKQECSCAFLKIYKKDTQYLSLGTECAPVPHGIFIDVFPMEGVPSNRLIRSIKGFFANNLRVISLCVFEYQYKSELLNEAIKTDSTVYCYIKMRRLIGAFFSFISSKRWFYFFDRFVANSDVSRLVGVPTGRKHYNGEVVDVSMHYPTTDHEFEGQTIHISGKWDEYLKMMYGDYMKIPPENKRESHMVIKLDIPNSY